VALRLAKEQGHAVTAFYLKIWLQDELSFLGDCPWEEDLGFVRAVCEQANVPLKVVSLQQEYQDRVVDHALRELKLGRTPSPDILCNERVKFGLFTERIDSGFEKIVSGHYAQIEPQDDGYVLKRSPDPIKDQTYFLSRLRQDQLRRLWFPIGHLTKSQVRSLAQEFELPNRNRKDSQGICFLGKIQYTEFVKYHLGQKSGSIVDVVTGKVLGVHEGAWFFTIGQREGLGLGAGPWYVVQKNLDSNTVYVAHRDEREPYGCKRFVVGDVHWILNEPCDGEMELASLEMWKEETTRPSTSRLQTKLRHTPHLEDCSIRRLPNGQWQVTLTNADFGVASGQSAVFYEDDICLGSGVIEQVPFVSRRRQREVER
jgi:tRNA (5-methylaminomethyl-2-thiouridylate)-methyltransferase